MKGVLAAYVVVASAMVGYLTGAYVNSIVTTGVYQCDPTKSWSLCFDRKADLARCVAANICASDWERFGYDQYVQAVTGQAPPKPEPHTLAELMLGEGS